jgi:hypothetical protein
MAQREGWRGGAYEAAAQAKRDRKSHSIETTGVFIAR